MLYDSEGELLAAAVPFLRERTAAGEAALSVCAAPYNDLLADSLDWDERVAVLPRQRLYTPSRRDRGHPVGLKKLESRWAEVLV
ncbi:hypothetical protein [Nonomuraea sp. NPDC050202]|uniref:hypothetical protein n=1 Tax=Nonomuraea sp. NPDC050202 TaxID=3155035 RepID=UPI0033CC4FEF